MIERAGIQAQLAELAAEVLAMPRERLEEITIAWQAKLIIQTDKDRQSVRRWTTKDLRHRAIFILAHDRHTLGDTDVQGRRLINDALDQGRGAIFRATRVSRAGVQNFEIVL